MYLKQTNKQTNKQKKKTTNKYNTYIKIFNLILVYDVHSDITTVLPV